MWVRMKPKSGAVHVARIDRKTAGKVYTYHFLRRSYREDGKVKHETLGNISALPEPVIEVIRRALRGDTLVGADDAFEVERSRPHGHVAATLGTLRRLGLEGLLGARPSRERALCVAMIVARVVAPSSKLATVRGLQQATLTSTLGELLGVDSANEDDLYGAMDWLLERQGAVEEALAARHLKDGSLVLYDLTSTYFEGRSCPLARRGHSRDGKRDKLQIVFGLLTDADGRPVAVEVFPGNTGDPTTVAAQVEKLRERFGLRRVVLVGDRGMITEARLRDDVRPAGLDWITALRAPAIAELTNTGTLQMSLFDERDLAEIQSPAFPGERLIACKNPALAEERRRKRLELLAATEKDLEKVVAATQRVKKPLQGQDQIGLRVGRVLGRYKMAKHFDVTIGDAELTYVRNEVRIAQEAALDGIYVVRTSVPKDTLSATDVVRSYKSLAKVERAFRSFKSVDLKVRPIHHRTADRVRAHVFLCMLAHYVEWHMREALKPLLFDDEEPAAGERRRTSAVAPAKRSEAADDKAATKTNREGQPVQSFRALLADLGTLARVRLRVAGSNQAFDRLSVPTPIQRRALDLLAVPTLA